MTSRLFCYGFGFSARALARRLVRERGADFDVCGTTRSPELKNTFNGPGRMILDSGGSQPDETIDEQVRASTHILVSASPDDDGDPMLRSYGETLRASKNLQWIGYLSTIGVYGDQGNAWVDEETVPAPRSKRARFRVAAEQEWVGFGEQTGRRVQIFRLAGIYGPGRSVIEKLKAGTARAINKPGQVFNRIHVDDIALVLAAAMKGTGNKTLYNVSDNEPAPPQDVVAYGARLLGMTPPKLIAYEEADLSPMGRSFYEEQRRITNARVVSDLNVTLKYPTYREGLAAIIKAG